MVRAPCCEKMGLKKGPWTAEEDQILVSHIHRFGHGNWRALPKQAGLLRCGKSCRLRWTNYLRPDIKRGNFTQEEEDTIINLHELLGNRWSAIAARLPGRTDNEIKNVWHTHLKKRVTPKPTSPEPTKKGGAAGMERPPAPATVNVDATASTPRSHGSELSSAATANCSSPAASSSSSTTTTTTTVTRETVDTGFPPENFLEEVMIESFWSGTLSLDSCDTSMDYIVESDGSQMLSSSCHGGDLTANATFNGDDMDLWLRLFMEAVELPELPTM